MKRRGGRAGESRPTDRVPSPAPLIVGLPGGGTVVLEGDRPGTVDSALADLVRPGGVESAGPVEVLRFGRAGTRWAILNSEGRTVFTTPYRYELLDEVVTRLNRLALDDDPGRLHLHAGCVEIEGRGVLLVGRSGSGKTTLTAELVRRGAAYLTDEMVGIAVGDRTIRPYHKPLTLKGWSIERYGGVVGIDALPPTSSMTEARVAVPGSRLGPLGSRARPDIVVFCRYSPEEEPFLRPVDPAAAVHRLVAETFDAARYGEATLHVLAALAAGAAVYELRHADVGAAAERMLGLADEKSTRGGVARSWGSVASLRSDHLRRVVVEGVVLEIDLKGGRLRTLPTEVAGESGGGAEEAASAGAAASPVIVLPEGDHPGVVWFGDPVVLEEAGRPEVAEAGPLVALAVDDTAPVPDVLRPPDLSAAWAEDSVVARDVLAASVPIRLGDVWVSVPSAAHRLVLQAMLAITRPDTTSERALWWAANVHPSVMAEAVEAAGRWSVLSDFRLAVQQVQWSRGRLPEDTVRALQRRPSGGIPGRLADSPRVRQVQSWVVDYSPSPESQRSQESNVWLQGHVTAGTAQAVEVLESLGAPPALVDWAVATRRSSDGSLVWLVTGGPEPAMEFTWMRGTGTRRFPADLDRLLEEAGSDPGRDAHLRDRADALSLRRDAGGRTRIRVLVGLGPGSDVSGTWYRLDADGPQLDEVVTHLDPGSPAAELRGWFEVSPHVDAEGLALVEQAVAGCSGIHIARRSDTDMAYVLGLGAADADSLLERIGWSEAARAASCPAGSAVNLAWEIRPTLPAHATGGHSRIAGVFGTCSSSG